MDAGFVNWRVTMRRTAKACGPDPPMPGSTPGSSAREDGGKKARSPRRARY